METHSSILAWEIPLTGAWTGTAQGWQKSDTYWLNHYLSSFRCNTPLRSESESVSPSVTSSSLGPHGPARLLCPWDSPGKNTGVCCRALLQGIFLTQGSNIGLPHCRQILYHLSHREAQARFKNFRFLFFRDNPYQHFVYTKVLCI